MAFKANVATFVLAKKLVNIFGRLINQNIALNQLVLVTAT